jgi:hypothetical protein
MSKKIPTPAEMKAAVEAFKNKFTKGFYHASPSNKIESFDPYHEASELGSSTMGGQKTANATFLTRDPPFANSFLPAGNARGYKPGSTIYPVSANLGKHFDYETPEGLQVIKEYLSKTYPVPKEEKLLQQWMRDRGLAQRDLKEGSWAAIEDPAFQQHLRDTSHDSFALQEAGRKNVGIFNPANIRGKFAEYNPAEAANPDFMKAEGGSIEHFQAGGASAVKKALEHARKLPFVHYSTAPNISYLEPKMYGSGIKGAEAARLKDAPDIKPRSYFYVDRGADTMRPEQGLGPHKYSGMAEDIYPLHDDPAGFSAIAKQKALDPYMMQFGREVVDQPTHLNELERLIKAAGYKGYSNDDVGLLFHPTPVTKAE